MAHVLCMLLSELWIQHTSFVAGVGCRLQTSTAFVSAAGTPDRIILSQHMHLVLAALWGFSCFVASGVADVEAEGHLFWMHLSLQFKNLVLEAVNRHQEATVHHDLRLHLFHTQAATVCSVLAPEVLLDRVAVALGDGAQGWMQPAWEASASGQIIVKGTHAAPIAFSS